MQIIAQKLDMDDKGQTYLYTKYSDGSISGEPITSEQAAEFEAANNY